MAVMSVMPAMNCTAERSFSTLKRIKSDLRSTMTQSRLNHLMIRKLLINKLDLELIANEFIDAKPF